MYGREKKSDVPVHTHTMMYIHYTFFFKKKHVQRSPRKIIRGLHDGEQLWLQDLKSGNRDSLRLPWPPSANSCTWGEQHPIEWLQAHHPFLNLSLEVLLLFCCCLCLWYFLFWSCNLTPVLYKVAKTQLEPSIYPNVLFMIPYCFQKRE